MTLTKYRMIIGAGYIETQSLEEAQQSGYEFVTVTEEVADTLPEEPQI